LPDSVTSIFHRYPHLTSFAFLIIFNLRTANEYFPVIVNSIMRPHVATEAPVVGVAVTAQSVVGGGSRRAFGTVLRGLLSRYWSWWAARVLEDAGADHRAVCI